MERYEDLVTGWLWEMRERGSEKVTYKQIDCAVIEVGDAGGKQVGVKGKLTACDVC